MHKLPNEYFDGYRNLALLLFTMVSFFIERMNINNDHCYLMLLKDLRESLLFFQYSRIETNYISKYEILDLTGTLGRNLTFFVSLGAAGCPQILKFLLLNIQVALLKSFWEQFELCLYCKYS